jgi:hypothetical protein
VNQPGVLFTYICVYCRYTYVQRRRATSVLRKSKLDFSYFPRAWGSMLHMITIFCDFCQFSAKKNWVFLNGMIQFLQKLAVIRAKQNAKFFAKFFAKYFAKFFATFFVENIFKIIPSVSKLGSEIASLGCGRKWILDDPPRRPEAKKMRGKEREESWGGKCSLKWF